MPELGEVSHAASLLKRFLQGKSIRKVVANDDNLLYVKPLVATVFKDSVENLTVNDVKRHGKYFWIEFKNSPRIVLLHFGMTGWITVKGIKTHFIAMENGGDKKARDQIAQGTLDSGIEVSKDPEMVWPPKFTKFILEADDDTQVAFTDPRRLGRVRLLEAENEQELFKQDPLSRNGIDFSKPEGRWDFEKFKAAVTRRQVPIKSLLMDQTIFAGVGNWVADEILFQSRVHPEVKSNQLDNVELKTLYEKLIYVCEYVVRVEGNTAAFPKDWLMLHRWGKRKKGEKQTVFGGLVVEHLTVGGRTSSYVPELQKKTRLKSEADQSPSDFENEVKPSKAKPKAKKAKVKIEHPQ